MAAEVRDLLWFSLCTSILFAQFRLKYEEITNGSPEVFRYFTWAKNLNQAILLQKNKIKSN